jgi:hypothetical protein
LHKVPPNEKDFAFLKNILAWKGFNVNTEKFCEFYALYYFEKSISYDTIK